MILALFATQAHALEHNVSFRWRHGWMPGGILDIWYYDEKDEGALGDRPGAQMDVFGLEYAVAPEITGPSFQVYVERMPIHMDAGYWDDVESPADHADGDWLQPEKGFGTWNIGVGYAHVLAFSPTDKPVWAGLSVGGGLGLAVVTGSITQWHPGYHEEVVDTTCLPQSTAIDRAKTCGSDGEVNLPGVLPMVDITVGPMMSIQEHARIRLDMGLHDVPYVGITAGGAF